MVIGQLLSLLWFNWSIINAEDYPIRAWLCIWMDNRLALFAKLWNWRPFVLVFQTAQGSKEIEIEIERWKRPSYQPPIDQIKASNKTHTHTHTQKKPVKRGEEGEDDEQEQEERDRDRGKKEKKKKKEKKIFRSEQQLIQHPVSCLIK